MDEEIKRRIWTCLEFTVRTHTELLKDRHLDQLIMCSLYIVCKVCAARNWVSPGSGSALRIRFRDPAVMKKLTEMNR
jgi:hypothetical protein